MALPQGGVNSWAHDKPPTLPPPYMLLEGGPPNRIRDMVHDLQPQVAIVSFFKPDQQTLPALLDLEMLRLHS